METLEEDFVPDYEEQVETIPEEEEVQTGISKRRGAMAKGGRACNLCPHRYSHMRRHMIASHLPWYFDPHSTCWICKLVEPQPKFLERHLKLCRGKSGRFGIKWASKWRALMLGLFWSIMNSVGCSDECKLVEWATANDCFKNITLNPRDTENMKLFDKDLEGDIDLGRTLSLAHLTHWRVFSNMLTKLSSRQVESICKQERLRLLSIPSSIVR